jgi:hypothetical protein
MRSAEIRFSGNALNASALSVSALRRVWHGESSGRHAAPARCIPRARLVTARLMTTAQPDSSVPQPTRLMLDTQGERTLARIRVAAAVLALISGVWLAWVEGGTWLRLTALASVAFALRWLSLQSTARATLADPQAHYLEIGADQLVIAAGAERRVIARNSVQAVELDDDRLVVVLRLSGGEELAIEPRYGDLSLRELGQVLHHGLCAPTHRDAQA